jgi:AraC-like DNA-binding protein
MPARPQFLFPDGARLGADNVILHARSRRHSVTEFAGPLSIKTVVDGAATWTVAGRPLPVGRDAFLVLGDGQRYSLEIDSPRSIETACAFFRGGFVEEVAQDIDTSAESSLDNPVRSAPPVPWLGSLHTDPDGRIAGRVQTMAKRCRMQLFPSGFEEDFLLLSHELLRFYREIAVRVARIPALRAGTREELFRRIETGREYLHSYAGGAVSLDAVARAACLSRYHFHRTFTQAFGQTPHAYLTEIRLARAHSLLQSGRSATQVCLDVGFASLPSFSRLFRARYGFPPSGLTKGRVDRLPIQGRMSTSL